MTIADFFLRIGVNAVGCLVAFVHLLFLLLIPKAACGPGVAGDPWMASSLTGAVLLPLLLLMGLARSHLHYFRWLTVVPAMMAAAALLVIVPYLVGTSFEGAELCSVRMGVPSGEASIVQRLWAPFELALIALLVTRTAQAWRGSEPHGQ